jgi:anti-sigma factor RsiW
MKKLPQHLDDLLLDYLDGRLEERARLSLEEQLKHDPSLSARLQELKQMNTLLHEVSLEQPSRNFTATVMNRLDQYPLSRGLSIRNGLLLLAGITVIMVMALVLVSSGVFDQTTTFDLNQVGPVHRYIKQNLPGVSVNGNVLVNVIVILNLALAFVVLDRAVLKPFFQRRMQTGH